VSRLRRLLHPVYKRLETTVHPLRYLFIEITQRCDLNCRHCGSDCGREAQVDELSTEEWLAFFDYLPKHVQTDKLLLVVTGGEPLCHPELDRMLEGISRNKLTWGMVTNAWSLDKKTMQGLLAHGVSTVTVSLDGLKKNHDWLRGRRHSFDRAVRGINLLTQAKLPFFDVVTCVNPRNLEELPQVLTLLKKLGVPQWRLFSIFPKGRARTNRELIMEGAQFARMLDFIREARADPDNRDISIQFSCEGYLPPELDRAVRDEPYFCRAGISIGSVLADGAISACPNISRELVQGNVRSDDFADVWENRYSQYRDRSWMKTGMCAECEHFSGCKGNSLHLWDEETHQTGLCSLHHLDESEPLDDE
jgi:radical SAM enzyme (rSAM/lipoprotein system)